MYMQSDFKDHGAPKKLPKTNTELLRTHEYLYVAYWSGLVNLMDN
jgi:hypothetical protein